MRGHRRAGPFQRPRGVHRRADRRGRAGARRQRACARGDRAACAERARCRWPRRSTSCRRCAPRRRRWARCCSSLTGSPGARVCPSDHTLANHVHDHDCPPRSRSQAPPRFAAGSDAAQQVLPGRRRHRGVHREQRVSDRRKRVFHTWRKIADGERRIAALLFRLDVLVAFGSRFRQSRRGGGRLRSAQIRSGGHPLAGLAGTRSPPIAAAWNTAASHTAALVQRPMRTTQPGRQRGGQRSEYEFG